MAVATDISIPGYDLGQRIDGGGMSEIFLAVRQADSRQVVVKIAPHAADEQTRQRLSKEHRLLSAINHPHVVKLLDCGCIGDCPYLVLTYIQGRSLRELLRPGQPLAWSRVAVILRQLSSALSALHAQDILHRDVKPENMLLDNEGQVKLIDLSIGTEVAEVGALTSQGQFLGTVDYMAPEQRHRIHIDQRTDQYSLAAVTFEMLTGHCCLGQFRRPSELNPRLTTAVDEVLLKGLERDPDDRFPSVESFTEAMLAAGTKQGRRRWFPVAAVCAAILLIGLVTCDIVYRNSAESMPAKADLTTPIASQLEGVAADKGQRVMTNTLGMKLVRIPAGTYQMGASSEEISQQFGGKVPKEVMHQTPKHPVTLTRPFWIGMHEVSVAQFRAFIEETSYQTTSEKWLAQHGRSPRQPVWNDPAHFSNKDDLPVTAVSWEDAVQFCKWLSDREGVTYRLPTEAEWEYACRAGTTGPWCCEEGELGDYAILSRLWADGPCPIGQRRPNAWGLHDMHGNVWEWCQDDYSASFYSASPEADPVSSESPSDGAHVLRSGGYFAGPRAVRSTMRRGNNNSVAYDDRGHSIGFRVACDASPPRVAKGSP